MQKILLIIMLSLFLTPACTSSSLFFPEHTIVATPDMVGLQHESGLDESISKYLKPDFAKKIKQPSSNSP
jgi:hypothetical protein